MCDGVIGRVLAGASNNLQASHCSRFTEENSLVKRFCVWRLDGGGWFIPTILGKANSYGGKGGLRKEGVYLWSRNPVYVASFVGMIGWGIFIGSGYVWVLLIVWSIVYLVAPFIEERWLAQVYGDDYIEYKSQVSRFFGLPEKINPN